MKFFAEQGFNVPIDDVWATVASNFTEGFANSVDRQRQQGLRHPRRLLPVGRLLPQERLRRQGLHRPDDLGRAQDAGRQDEDRRDHPDRVRRQGRLARDGHVRHPEPAAERLRLPRRADGRRLEVDRPQGHRGVRQVEGAHPLPVDRLRRPHLAAGRRHARPEEGRHVPARAVRLGAVRRDQRPGRPGRPRLLRLPGPRAPSSTRRRRSTPRSTPSRSPRSRRTSRPSRTPPRRTSSTGPRARPRS